jgi:hypothetical protein
MMMCTFLLNLNSCSNTTTHWAGFAHSQQNRVTTNCAMN